MAVAGGITTAYQCKPVIVNDRLTLEIRQTSYPRERCASPADAYIRLLKGDTVTVAGSDMAALRAQIAALNGDV
jgi:translation initiation factor IF-1